ncbi:restriction endonuclease [Polyangium mundeleinium]|uniref:Restriction endonuclease n=1 Tax=Polyangium mundeleinium TaxID=2995306 RepID=A0ABT5F7C3_9BACT|nr:restriction endonuclease [Polyangium mundeleinium]MDC0750004.1 restriction endonuclease [Polyangium mundeleinium]
MPRYWVMRVDHRGAKDFLWNELKAGRLRQGWGYREDQNLETIAARKRKDAGITDEQQAAWRGNRRMLGAEPDSIQKGDVILVAHLPNDRHWSIVRVVGPYRFQIPKAPKDYGHILPVELLSEERPVGFQAKGVAAGLRQTMRNLSRLWNIDHLGEHVEQILKGLEEPTGRGGDDEGDRLVALLGELEVAGWERFKFHFQGAEFEAPCVRLLETLYGEGNVEHTGGKNENGADAICTYRDPLGVPHRVAVQIKMWSWDTDWTRPLQQIKKACQSYEGITSGVILSTSERVTPGFETARTELQKELGLPVRVVLRRELLRLFIHHLPKLVSMEAEPEPDR